MYAEIGHMSAFELQAKTVGTTSFVKVAFICLKFRVGSIVLFEAYQTYRLGTAGLRKQTSRSIAITAKPCLHAHFSK